MALAKVLRGKNLLIKVSDEGGTPVFAHPCLINAARGIEIETETNSVRVPDCSDPELISWLSREKIAVGATLTGAGVLNTTDTEFYFGLVTRADPIAIQIELAGVSAANGGGYISGNWLLTRFGLSGDLGDHVQSNLTWESDGALTWTDAS